MTFPSGIGVPVTPVSEDPTTIVAISVMATGTTVVAVHFLENGFHSFCKAVNGSPEAFDEFSRILASFECQHLRVTASDFNGRIHHIKGQLRTECCLTKKVRANGLNHVITELAMAEKPTMCTACCFRPVIWQNQTICKTIIYGAAAKNTVFRGSFIVVRLLGNRYPAERLEDGTTVNQRLQIPVNRHFGNVELFDQIRNFHSVLFI